jgi:hypothetical protein
VGLQRSAEHIGPVGVDFRRRRRRTVLSQHPAAGLKWRAWTCIWRKENLFQYAACKAVGRNALRLRLSQQNRFQFVRKIDD